MKKIILISSILSISLSGFAQDLKIGVLAGLNLSKLENDLNGEFERILGYNVGFLASIGLADQLSIKTGVIYKRKNARFDTTVRIFDENAAPIGTMAFQIDFQYGYISIPAFLAYQISPVIKLTGGPNFDINIAESYSTNDPKIPFIDEANDLIIGFNLGPTLMINRLEFNLLYNRSFNNASYETSEYGRLDGFEFNISYYFLNR